MEYKSGFLLIDKPKGLTSFDIVREIKKILKIKKVGHSGTLDPLATGLLLVAFGEGTKFLEFLIGCDKAYETLAVFGSRSDSYDADGEISEVANDFKLDEKVILELIKNNFLGEIEQIPPKYSALKIDGKRAYELARSGESFEMKKRKVSVKEFSLLDLSEREARFRISCGSGTYIRSLVNDLGEKLNVGAYVKELRRTVIGAFEISKSVKLEDLSNKIDRSVISIEDLARSFESCDLSLEEFSFLKDGRVLMGKKIDQENVVAFCEGKCVGFLENYGGGLKFKKRINLEV